MPNTTSEDGSGTAPEESIEIVQFDATVLLAASGIPTAKL
jgi:hypothetical protein